MKGTNLVVLDDSSKFESKLKDCLDDDQNVVFGYFYGSIKEETGLSWCPDCTDSEPIVEDIIKKTKDKLSKSGTQMNIVIIKVMVKRDEYKGNPDYVFRKHRLIRLKSLPTFIQFNSKDRSDTSVRLEESDFEQKGKINQFVSNLKL